MLGFAVASLLLFNALFVLGRALRVKSGDIRARLSIMGGSLTHAAMAVILVGLVGSAMYVSSHTFYLPYDEESDTYEYSLPEVSVNNRDNLDLVYNKANEYKSTVEKEFYNMIKSLVK